MANLEGITPGQQVYTYLGESVGVVVANGESAFQVTVRPGRLVWLRHEAVMSVEATAVYLTCGNDGLGKYVVSRSN